MIPCSPRSSLFPYTTLFRSDVHLDAERAAHVVGDDAHLMLGQPEVLGEDILHHVRRLGAVMHRQPLRAQAPQDRKSTRLNSSHVAISYAVFCLKKKKEGRHD